MRGVLDAPRSGVRWLVRDRVRGLVLLVMRWKRMLRWVGVLLLVMRLRGVVVVRVLRGG